MQKAQRDSIEVFKKIFGDKAEGFLVGLQAIPDVLIFFSVLIAIAHAVYVFHFPFSKGMFLLFFLDFLFFVTHRNALHLYGVRYGCYLVTPEAKLKLIFGNPDWTKQLKRSFKGLMLRVFLVLALYFVPFFLYLIVSNVLSLPESINVAMLFFSMGALVYPVVIFFYNAIKTQDKYADRGIVLVNDPLDALVGLYAEKNHLVYSSELDLNDLYEFSKNPEYQEAQEVLNELKGVAETGSKISLASKLIK